MQIPVHQRQAGVGVHEESTYSTSFYDMLTYRSAFVNRPFRQRRPSPMGLSHRQVVCRLPRSALIVEKCAGIAVQCDLNLACGNVGSSLPKLGDRASTLPAHCAPWCICVTPYTRQISEPSHSETLPGHGRESTTTAIRDQIRCAHELGICPGRPHCITRLPQRSPFFKDCRFSVTGAASNLNRPRRAILRRCSDRTM